MNLLLCICITWLSAASPAPRTWNSAAQDTDAAIQALRAVGDGAAGAAAARQAVAELVRGREASLLPILEGFRGASPLAANWLRNAFETTANAIRRNHRQLPAEPLLEFIRDRSQSPQARRLAYEWLLKQDDDLREELIPDMLLDPSPEFRRDAVAMLIDAAADAESPQQSTMFYRRALTGAVHEDQVREIAQALRKQDIEVDTQNHFGFLSSWKIIGPFDNRDESGFAVAYPPESEIDLDAEYEGQLGPVRWQEIATADDFGIVDIAEQIENYKGSVMYATTTFQSPDDQQVDLRLGTPNAWKLWVNGELVFEREEYHRSSRMDQYRVPVSLRKGPNRVLLKICQNEMTQDWAQRYQFQLRVCDATGSAVRPVVQAATSPDSAQRND